MILTLVLLLQVAASDVRVVDGDTLDYQGARYRVFELDAPEIGRARCLAERRLGEAARREAERLIANAGVVEIEPTGRVQPATQRYRERIEARVLIDGRDLGDLLTEAGLAQPWSGRRAWCAGR